MTKSTKTNHYTYIIRHINGRYYVGRRSTKKDPLLDPYMGSGIWVKSIKDRSTLTKDIIAYYPNTEELKIGEMELIDEYFDDVYCMNLAYSSCGFVAGCKSPMYDKKHTEKAKKKMSTAKSGNKHPMYDNKHTDKTKQKMSSAKSGNKCYMYGKKLATETKDKISAAKSGEKAYNATITDHIAKMIKIRIAEGLKNKPIAEEFSTTVAVVQGIRIGKNWKHINI